MRILVDTNVLISAMVFGGKPRSLLVDLMEKGHTLLVTSYVRDELHETLLLKWSDKAEKLFGIFEKMEFAFCDSVDPDYSLQLRDPKDIPVLTDAIYYKADVILSGDKDFLEAKFDHPAVCSVSMLQTFLG